MSCCFQTLDWDAVARREVPAPFVPALAHAADTCNFADEFTRMPPTDSPAHAPNHHDKLFLGESEKDYELFFPGVLGHYRHGLVHISTWRLQKNVLRCSSSRSL